MSASPAQQRACGSANYCWPSPQVVETLCEAESLGEVEHGLEREDPEQLMQPGTNALKMLPVEPDARQEQDGQWRPEPSGNRHGEGRGVAGRREELREAERGAEPAVRSGLLACDAGDRPAPAHDHRRGAGE